MSADGKVAACLKHFAGYGACEGGRDYGYTEISRQTLWDTYLPPYEAGVKAGAATVMSAFTNISGVPATINKYLLTDILKEKWGHDGFIVSDWGAIGQLLNQGATADSMECAALFVKMVANGETARPPRRGRSIGSIRPTGAPDW